MRYCGLLLALALLGCSGGSPSPTVAERGPAPEKPKPSRDPSKDRGLPPTGGSGFGNPSRQKPPSQPTQPRIDVVAELEKMPVGLEIVHTPDKVTPTTEARTTQQGWTTYWNYKTEVRAKERPLTVILFGTLIQEGDRWVLPQQPGDFEAMAWPVKDFIEWYKCPGAKIEPGKPVTDPDNWSGAKVATGFKQKWFIIAKDDDGKRYKGEAVVELLPK